MQFGARLVVIQASLLAQLTGSSGDLVTEMFAAITSSADCFILPPTVGGASEEGPTSTAAPVAKAMDSNHGNIDLAASVNQLQYVQYMRETHTYIQYCRCTLLTSHATTA